MCLPALTFAGLAFLEVNAQHAGPEAKGLLEVIGRKFHQGDRMPRHRVKTHIRSLEALRVRDRAHTREGDAIAAARRRLPMVESTRRRR